MKGMEFLEKFSETDCANIVTRSLGAIWNSVASSQGGGQEARNNAMASHGLSDFAQAVKLIFSENHSCLHGRR
ncbi:MAG TPA: hypothetical protein EYH06_04055 [Chromatiales bacterium]|nr:hypothetical protein [Chromatiales bacterium]